MKIINRETGVMLEASDEIARGYLQNPTYVEAIEEEMPTAPRAGRKVVGKKETRTEC